MHQEERGYDIFLNGTRLTNGDDKSQGTKENTAQINKIPSLQNK